MSTNLTMWTTETQSTFGMPTYGAAFRPAACSGFETGGMAGTFGAVEKAISGQTVTVIDVPVRDRHVALDGAFPGTTVWRPPKS